ncbi:MAG: SufE family protein [Verrucomicrobia bacterium]|nr:SufE family protein [Verrucomicrobiota bacterium]MBS0636953.1 SufE family protein [Verrucomicrobiota bacterium]
MSFESCLQKQQQVKELFSGLVDIESKYDKIIEIGRSQCHLNPKYKTDEYLVRGCQSRMYLVSYYVQGKVYFESEADAIISAGLSTLLIRVYSGEDPTTILKCPPTYLEELNIPQTLTPGRANGLASIYLRMKQDALRYLVSPQEPFAKL